MKRINVSIILLMLIAFSCDIIEKEESTTDTVEAKDAIVDYSIAVRQFQGVGNEVNAKTAGMEDDVVSMIKSTVQGDYPVISIEPADFSTFPKTVTVDYGTDGVTGWDGRKRRGKLITTLENGWYREMGSVHTTTFENYYQNDYKIEGEHIVINTGTNMSDQYTFKVQVKNGKITDDSGNVIQFTQDTQRTWIEGEETRLNVWDDVYEVSGTQSGEASNGVAFDLTTRNDNPLLVDLSCPYIKSGILDIDIEGLPAMNIDYYQDLDADDLADCSPGFTLTIAGVSTTIQ